MTFFTDVPLAPPDAIFGLASKFKADPSGDKVDLVIGAYRDEDGKPWVLPVVRKVEIKLANEGVEHEYLPIDGLQQFKKAASELLLGNQALLVNHTAVQTLSGTGALRIGAEFIARIISNKIPVYIPDPTWANHKTIFSDANLSVQTYRYFDKNTVGLDFMGMMADLKEAPNKSVILLHVCAHNPTGNDPTHEQWEQIAELIKEKEHFTFFDSAYQGFASGDVNNDAFAVRLFAQMGLEFFVAQSFAKNMGLYGERIGNLIAVCKNPEDTEKVKSQLKRIVRGMVSNCPAQGARICSTILNDPTLYEEWLVNVKEMAGRIKSMRHALYDQLIEKKTPGKWDHILSQIGMFTFTGLSAKQCEMMMEKHHVYLTTNGRISLAGLNTKNVAYVASAIHDVVVNCEK